MTRDIAVQISQNYATGTFWTPSTPIGGMVSSEAKAKAFVAWDRAEKRRVTQFNLQIAVNLARKILAAWRLPNEITLQEKRLFLEFTPKIARLQARVEAAETPDILGQQLLDKYNEEMGNDDGGSKL